MTENAAEEQKTPAARGIYAALATPRREDSIEADAGALLDYIDAITGAGVQGLVLFGSTGEFVHFELEERMRVAGLAIKRSRVPLLVNASHSTLAGAVTLAEHAFAAGAAGVLLTPPYFYLYSQNQLFEFYAQFVKAVEGSGPVYLYNLPMFLNPISADLAARLLGTGSFAGIKDSSGDWNLFQSLLDLRKRQDFRLLAGNESIYVKARSAGADGAVSGVAAAVPELMVRLDQAIVAGETAVIESTGQKLAEFLGYIERFPSTLGIRQAAATRGWAFNEVAVPFDNDTADAITRFQNWFREWLPAVLAECGQMTGVRT